MSVSNIIDANGKIDELYLSDTFTNTLNIVSTPLTDAALLVGAPTPANPATATNVAKIQLVGNLDGASQKEWDIAVASAGHAGYTGSSLEVWGYDNAGAFPDRRALLISEDAQTVTVGNDFSSNPVLQLSGTVNDVITTGRVYDEVYNPIPSQAGMMLPLPSDFEDAAPNANNSITTETPWVASGPINANGLVEFFIKDSVAKAGPYMIQVIFTVDAASVITAGEFIRLEMYDNVMPKPRYFGGVLVIPTDNLKPPTLPTSTYYPTNTYVYNTTVWLDPSRVGFDPFIWCYLQKEGNPTTQTTSITNCQIAVYPMFSK